MREIPPPSPHDLIAKLAIVVAITLGLRGVQSEIRRVGAIIAGRADAAIAYERERDAAEKGAEP